MKIDIRISSEPGDAVQAVTVKAEATLAIPIGKSGGYWDITYSDTETGAVYFVAHSRFLSSGKKPCPVKTLQQKSTINGVLMKNEDYLAFTLVAAGK